MRAMRGKGQFQWNTGGWFGAQLGGTCWLAIFAIMLFAGGYPAVGLAVLTCFLIPNVLGFWLWRRRDRVQPHPAIQLLLATMAVTATLALVLFHVTSADEVFAGGERFQPRMYLYLLFYPAMMLMFYVVERGGRKRDSRLG